MKRYSIGGLVDATEFYDELYDWDEHVKKVILFAGSVSSSD